MSGRPRRGARGTARARPRRPAGPTRRSGAPACRAAASGQRVTAGTAKSRLVRGRPRRASARTAAAVHRRRRPGEPEEAHDRLGGDRDGQRARSGAHPRAPTAAAATWVLASAPAGGPADGPLQQRAAASPARPSSVHSKAATLGGRPTRSASVRPPRPRQRDAGPLHGSEPLPAQPGSRHRRSSGASTRSARWFRPACRRQPDVQATELHREQDTPTRTPGPASAPARPVLVPPAAMAAAPRRPARTARNVTVSGAITAWPALRPGSRCSRRARRRRSTRPAVTIHTLQAPPGA